MEYDTFTPGILWTKLNLYSGQRKYWRNETNAQTCASKQPLDYVGPTDWFYSSMEEN
jgi:hypothetical protein